MRYTFHTSSFGSWDTNFYALNTNDGSLKWSFEAGWGIETTPVSSYDLIFVGSHDNNMYALDIENGNLEWIVSCKAGIHSSPVVDDNYLLFGSDDGRLYVVNIETGEILKQFSPGNTIDDIINYLTTPILSDILINDGIIYTGILGDIYSLSL